jgi:tetratricopeptide (TPR) repeat protein
VPMNLGIYYWTKANGLRQDGDASRGWDEKAMAVLERAVQLDRAENDVNRRLEVLRGKAPDAVADVGTWKTYQYLGLVAWQLERYPQAIEAFGYIRHLWPAHSAAYLDMARVQRVSGRLEDAAVTALQVLTLDPNDRAARALLVEIYDQVDAGGCALVAAPSGRRLNPACPRVHADVCSAYAGLAEVFRDAKQEASAEEFTRRAARDRCT